MVCTGQIGLCAKREQEGGLRPDRQGAVAGIVQWLGGSLHLSLSALQ